MANTITNVLPRLLAQGLRALRELAIMPRVVNRSYDALAQQQGDVINIPIPSAVTATAVTPSITPASNQDINPTTVAVTLDFWREATFQMSDQDLKEVMMGTIPMQASEAIKALANAIDDYILGKHVGIFSFSGTEGTTPFSTAITVAGSARTLLNKQLAGQNDRRAVLDPDAEGNFLVLGNILQTDQRGDQGGIINGTIGRKLGIEWFMDQNITTFTPGTGWASGNIASTLSGAVGETTLNIINATASGQIKVGDLFSVVGSVDGSQYVVTVTTTLSATVAGIITFTPALVSAVDTGTTLAVVSIVYVANLMFHRDAFAWASRPLLDIQGLGNPMTAVTDPISGISLRLEVSRQYKQTTFSYDVLGGAALIRAELATKILG